jgi:ribosomal protein L32
MGVSDQHDGEHGRDGAAVLVQGRGGSPQTPYLDGPDSKSGGTQRNSGRWATTTADYNSDSQSGDMSPPNTVAMSVTARGKSAPGGYRSTGMDVNDRDSLGNNKQQTYNDALGLEGAKGTMMAVEPSNFYNDVGGNKNDPDGGANIPTGDTNSRAQRIEGFGSGKNTFNTPSHDYNFVGGEGAAGNGDGDSGSGLLKAARNGVGAASKIRGFSSDDSLKSGMI